MNKRPFATNQCKVCVTTLGCKVNQFESESIRAEMQSRGWNLSDETEAADVCIINTCTVTQKASMQSRQAIRRAIRENPKAIIVATGCYAQSEPLELQKIKGLDYIIANSDKHRIARILNDTAHPHKSASHPVVFHQDIRLERCLHSISAPIIGNRTRPFIKIQDGCDNFCTYCIVPYTRGPSRSLPPDAIMEEIFNLPPDKTNEIVLTGIHLGRYGMDFSPPVSLLDLLRRIHETGRIGRIRLSSIEPVEFTDDLLHFAATSQRICHHFHIPLQSGDASILKKMNRPYDPELFIKLIQKIHTAIPDAAIGVDVMVGFPGETDAAFDNTYQLLEKLPIDYLHAFPFSSRPGTPASRFPGQVDSAVIKERQNGLLALGMKKKALFYHQIIGKTLVVMVENKRDNATGFLTGVSGNYVRVLIDDDDHLKSRLIPCRILKPMGKKAVLGEVVSDGSMI
ncbi:MAG: tRNA (N(6)-L-threonylcarbamoyladenosine(37)-C(2))-methylthiotransferase MtaB [Desulfosalsimonadaceae bacterium]